MRILIPIRQAPAGLRQELIEIKRRSSQTMDELLAGNGRSAAPDDHGLIPALHGQARGFSDQTGIRCTFKTRGPAPRLSPEQQLTIYRITQESLSNVAQHALAHKVEVELSFVGNTVLRISDDGSGFTDALSGGLGVAGMRELALLTGGHLSIWSGRGQGTRVELTLK
jgi:two-component system, NarL family, sensor histidine kinase UhpB